MNIRAIVTLGMSALVLGGTMVGCTAYGDRRALASAGSRSDAALARQASGNAGKARKALAAGDHAAAVSFAEAAVAMQPREAAYRALLGQSYLKAGRFASAETACGEALAIRPDDAGAALNLVLAQLASGHADLARQTMDAHARQIAPTDLGLVLALSGSAEAGVQVLMSATRSPQATARTRQNLALALALAGRWKEARIVAGVDLAPVEADQRIVQWAAFSRASRPVDQVAALLGVTPASDPGRPVALALNAAVPVATDAPAAPAAMVAPLSTSVAMAAETKAEHGPETATVAPVALAAAPLARVAGITFAAPRAVVQPVPAASYAAAGVALLKSPASSRRRPDAPAPRERGDYQVQVGAFSSSDVARDAWSRVRRHYAAFASKLPAAMTYQHSGRMFYRLSIGGFTRAGADAACRSYRAQGGACFVRPAAGDQVAQWALAGRQLAAR